MAKKECKSPQQIWEDVSSVLVNCVEGLFYKLGVLVAENPWKTISFTLLFVAVSSIGLITFHIEKNPMNLWVPRDSDFFMDTDWYIKEFQTGIRIQNVLVTSDNILQPNVLKTLSKISSEINSMAITYKDVTYTFQELCYKIPIIKFLVNNKIKRSLDSKTQLNDNSSDLFTLDPSLLIASDFYCDIIESFPLGCLQQNLLDIWKFSEKALLNVTHDIIVEKINNIKVNPSTGHPVDYTKTLGGVEINENGQIVSAKSAMLTWYTFVNFTEVNLDEVGNLVGTQDWVSMPLLIWEKSLLEVLDKLKQNITTEKLYFESGRSFGDVSGESIFHDMDKLFLGIFLMFVYIQIILSRCNWLEIRLTLGGVGLMCVGLAYVTAVSWCSIFGVSFGPVHSSLPFLLMGLGIDDMFVMKACWEEVMRHDTKESLPIKIGLMLKHAGVSIVITSFTDIVALLIGAITILPSLRSFCFYAAAGVFFIFCYSVTYYVAIFTLDVKRIRANRNGILFCYQHKKPIEITETESWFQKLFNKFYKNIIFTKPVKALVVLFTVGMTAFSVEAMLKLEQRFDPSWFIPDGTYYRDFLDQYRELYPDDGHSGMIILGKMNYTNEFIELYDMVQEFRKEPYIHKFDTWIEKFHFYVLKNFNKDITNITLSDNQFDSYLSSFLFSSSGGRFQVNMRFEGKLICGEPAPKIRASSMMFRFKRFAGPSEYLPAMNKIKSIVKSADIGEDVYRSVWSKVFANWVTDEIIAVEVERNIELALLCVMLCTFVLITNLQMCLWIFVCVLLTIINVLGWMQRWGMTVDIVCCIGLELAIGLCVDYAAHVGHTFLTISEGSRTERALKTVTSIGAAVLFGGGATLLSLSLLSRSKAYTFQSFFKIFLLVILYGLFHGLVFLPVGLSLLGPKAYKHKSKEIAIKDMEELVELNGKPCKSEKDVQNT